MIFLLDTCVLAEIRHPKGSAKVKASIESLDEDALVLSVLTIGEIVKGIAQLKKRSRRRRELEDWLERLVRFYGDRVIPVDAQTASIWGEKSAEAARKGEVVPVIDGLIAATALQHGHTVVTRNTRHFRMMGVQVMDPWG